MSKQLSVVRTFLEESNHIENVWDERSLKDAVKAWNFLDKENALTVTNILKTHRILMTHTDIDSADKGAWRQCEVMIGGRLGKSWYAVPILMQKWIHDANTLIRMKDKWAEEHGQHEERIKALHIEFEKIHPFVDGNGRVGRILLNWQRIRIALPVLVIKDAARYDYYQWFR